MQDYPISRTRGAPLDNRRGSAVGVVHPLPVGHEQPLNGIAVALDSRVLRRPSRSRPTCRRDADGELGWGEGQGTGGRKHPPFTAQKVKCPAPGARAFAAICASCLARLQTSRRSANSGERRRIVMSEMPSRGPPPILYTNALSSAMRNDAGARGYSGLMASRACSSSVRRANA